MKILFACILIGLISSVNAQSDIDFSSIDKTVAAIPKSDSKSTEGIAEFINSNFSGEKEKTRAIFMWIAYNIEYDIENMFAINFYQNKDEIIDEVLKTKKGICLHYSELFYDIASKTGIQSHIVTGCTKQNGFVDYIPHAWCASKIDSIWYIFDPTWGSGYIQNSRFIAEINNFYFMTDPNEIVKSHLPFDPLWQLLNYPITSQEFYDEQISIDKNKTFFDFIDTIVAYENESEIEKLISSSRRIKQNGVKNSMTFDKLQQNKREIEFIINNINVEKYNSSVFQFNAAIASFNKFINYRNAQFTPKKNDDQILEMFLSAEKSLTNSKNLLIEISNPDNNFKKSIGQLRESINEAFVNINEQKVFLDKYFNTKKIFRKSLFYK